MSLSMCFIKTRLHASLQPTRRAQLCRSVSESLLLHYGDQTSEIAAELAQLLEGARDHARAAEYYLQAARKAVRVFANRETVMLARRGLDLVEKLAESSERDRLELALLITLGAPLKDTEGWAAPEVKRVYERAHRLCRQIGQAPELFPALFGLWLFHSSVSPVSASRDMGLQLLDLAEKSDDTGMMLQAHHALATTYVVGGNWTATREHADKGLALYDENAHREHKYLYGGHDPGTCCLGWSALCLWMLGFADQAIDRGRRSLELGQKLGHPMTLALTHWGFGTLLQLQGDAEATEQQAEACQRIVSEHGLPVFPRGLQGWALVQQGRTKEGLMLLHQTLDATVKAPLSWRVYFIVLLGESLMNAGHLDDAWKILSLGDDLLGHTEVGAYVPELHRLQGEILMKSGTQRLPTAEACLRRALGLARSQKAKALELRAATSLCRLLHGRDEGAVAQAQLIELYDSFTEGFQSNDLDSAKAIISGHPEL